MLLGHRTHWGARGQARGFIIGLCDKQGGGGQRMALLPPLVVTGETPPHRLLFKATVL